MATDHGRSVKNDNQYEELRKKGMSNPVPLPSPTRAVAERATEAVGPVRAAGSAAAVIAPRRS